MPLPPGTAFGRDGKPLNEKRRHSRVSLDTEVWLGQDGIFARLDTQFVNLSATGACLHRRAVYSVGSAMKLKFRLPDDSEAIISTVVVRNSLAGQGVGIEFLDLSSRATDRIRSFVKSVRT